MALFEPLDKEFRSKSDKLSSSLSKKEVGVIESYFQQAIGIMEEIAGKLNE